MAPLSRAAHLGGSGLFAVLYGLIRATLPFVVVALFFGLPWGRALRYGRAIGGRE